jgi:hypothetical protein
METVANEKRNGDQRSEPRKGVEMNRLPDSKVASKLFVWSILSLVFCVSPCRAQSQQKTPEKQESHQARFFQQVINGAIFIYGTQVDPCAPAQPGPPLLPFGSGFVVGIANRTESKPELWKGWKYLVTAKHVVSNQNEIFIRLNAAKEPKFLCQRVALHSDGPARNMVLAPPGTDLVAIALPEIADADPTVVPSSLLVDDSKMKESDIGVGTEVVSVGYLYGYSGLKANYPMAKFGHVSVMSDERWFTNPSSNIAEQGYVLDLSNAPGLSGAPVYTHGIEFRTNPFQYRELPTYLIGVVKAIMLAPVGNQAISFGTTVIEPGASVKSLMREIANVLKAEGVDAESVD